MNELELYEKAIGAPFTVKKLYLREPGEKGYWIYRFLRPILKLRYYSFRYFHKPCPWLAPSAVRFLKLYLTKEMKGIEFGSGISTLFIAPKVKHLISIEHNKEWYELISERFKTMGIHNVDYRFIAQNDSKMFESAEFEMEKELNFPVRRDYFNYFMTVQSLPDESLDFILVDGRARPECMYHALPKLKKGALIILDNSERKHYEIVFKMLEKFTTFNTTNGLTDTTFWVKG